MDHAEIKDLIPLKALSRLDGDEARAVDEHLAAGCDECERELASFNEALAAMAMVESGGDGPSDRIWSRLQARLDAERPAQRIEDRSVREPSRGRGFAMLGSAAVAAVVAIAVSYAFFNSRVSNVTTETSNEIAALTAKVIEVQRNRRYHGRPTGGARGQGRADYGLDAGKSRARLASSSSGRTACVTFGYRQRRAQSH